MFDMNNFFGADNEAPLDRPAVNGGLCRIFRTVACVGDSLASGEFEALSDEGVVGCHDMYEYSWGQHMARAAGIKVYNFSAGGMTAYQYVNSFAELNGMWDRDKLAQCYIIALGVNDWGFSDRPHGSAEDINLKNWRNNKQTFAGDYARIICRYKEMQPDARFFLVTAPKNEKDKPSLEGHSELIYSIAEKLDNTYVIDFDKYGPVCDADFRSKYFLGNHLNAAGYVLFAELTMSYMDWIIRHNPEDFSQVGFIGTPYYYSKLKG